MSRPTKTSRISATTTTAPTLRKEPNDKDRRWDIVGEDDLGLSSRYLTKFTIIDCHGRQVNLEDLVLFNDQGKRLKHTAYYAIGYIYNTKMERMLIRTNRIVEWDVELGNKSISAGIWIATNSAWYKLIQPKESYLPEYSALLKKTQVAIAMYTIVDEYRTTVSPEHMTLELLLSALMNHPKVRFDLEAHRDFLIDHMWSIYDMLTAEFDPSLPFMKDLELFSTKVLSSSTSTSEGMAGVLFHH